MVMVFDESGSITQRHFETSKEFARDVINGETDPYGSLYLELGIQKFGATATLVQSMTSSASQALAAVNFMTYGTGATNIADGLSKAWEMIRYNRGEKLILLWTDGRHNQAGDPVQVARDLKSQGVCIIVIGIGPDVDDAQLKQIEGCSNNSPTTLSWRCLGNGLLIKTNFNEIERNVSGFVSKVQSTFEAGAQCAA